jgi:hypothetical protein
LATHHSFLVYRNFQHLKGVVLVCFLAIVLYMWHSPIGSPNGGTWLGYIYGTIAAAIIGLLMWYGVRKRQFTSTQGTIQAWLSAHVYLGASLLVIGTLHTGFQFGMNVHTLAYLLMVLVILSGFWGIYAYIRYPTLMTRNRSGTTRAAIMGEINDLDRECLTLADRVDQEAHNIFLDVIESTVVGGTAKEQVRPELLMRVHDGAQHAFTDKLARTPDAEQVRTIRALIEQTRIRSSLVLRLKQDIQYQALLEIWLFIHVPLSFALVAALITHILSVFLYW